MSALKSNRGISVISVVIMMLIMAAMGSVLVSLVATGNDTSIRQMKTRQAQYIAEGGMEYILAPPRVFPNFSTNGATVSLGAGSFQTDTPAYLTVALSSGATTITVNSTTGFAGSGRIVIDSEVIAYTGTTATTFTGATRGSDGTTAVAHSNGNSVYPVTRLTADPGAGGTTMNVNSTTGFLIPGVIKIGSEYIYCTGSTGTTFTSCIRGYRGTTAAAHAINSDVFQYVVISTGKVTGAYSNAQRVVKVSVDSSGAGGAGIAFDANSSAAQNNVSSLTWSHTVSGANRILIVGVSLRDGSGQTVNSVTYNGTALTFIGAISNSNNNVRVEMWKLVAPATGANNVVVNLSASARVVGGAVSLTGVDQTNPIDASFVSNLGTSKAASVSITTVANNAWVIDTLCAVQVTVTAGGGQTEQWNTKPGTGSANPQGAGSTEGPKTPAGSVTMSWSLASSKDWAIGAVSVKPATGSGVSALDWREVFP